MRVILFGIYKIGVESLAALLERRIEIVGVVTKPSTPEERQPVATAAARYQIPCFAPESPGDPAFLKQIDDLAPDLIVVAGFHKIFPKALLEIPRRGAINLHLSLLPRYRGPCPWKWALVNGETVTGATVIMLSTKVDCGDILAQLETPIADADTGESLFERLSVLGSRLLAETTEAFQAGPVTRQPQDERLASYQSAPTDEQARIHWGKSAGTIRNLVRGFYPRPGAWTTYAGNPLVIGKVSLKEGKSESRPGTVVKVLPDGIVVATGDGLIAIHDLTPKEQPNRKGNLWPKLLIRPGTCFEESESEKPWTRSDKARVANAGQMRTPRVPGAGA